MRRGRIEEKTISIGVTGDDGRSYTVTVEYERVCDQAGNFSCRAMDPDEYFGVYHNEHATVTYAMVLNDDGWDDCDDIPEDVEEKAIDEVEDYA